jgi:hypothetical protein
MRHARSALGSCTASSADPGTLMISLDGQPGPLDTWQYLLARHSYFVGQGTMAIFIASLHAWSRHLTSLLAPGRRPSAADDGRVDRVTVVGQPCALEPFYRSWPSPSMVGILVDQAVSFNANYGAGETCSDGLDEGKSNGLSRWWARPCSQGCTQLETQLWIPALRCSSSIPSHAQRAAGSRHHHITSCLSSSLQPQAGRAASDVRYAVRGRVSDWAAWVSRALPGPDDLEACRRSLERLGMDGDGQGEGTGP